MFDTQGFTVLNYVDNHYSYFDNPCDYCFFFKILGYQMKIAKLYKILKWSASR